MSELQKQNPSLAACYESGRRAAGYGWACTPWGHWQPKHVAAQRKGYDDARAGRYDPPTDDA